MTQATRFDGVLSPSPLTPLTFLGETIALAELGTAAPFRRYLPAILEEIIRGSPGVWTPRTLSGSVSLATGLSLETSRLYLRAVCVWIIAEPEAFPGLELTRQGRKFRSVVAKGSPLALAQVPCT